MHTTIERTRSLSWCIAALAGMFDSSTRHHQALLYSTSSGGLSMTEQRPTTDLATLLAQGTVQAPPEQLTQDAKEQLAEDGTPFTVEGISYGDSGDFGPYWQFDVNINGKPATFRLSSNANRDPFIQSLAAATGQTAISGVRLRAIDTRGGNKFLTVEQA